MRNPTSCDARFYARARLVLVFVSVPTPAPVAVPVFVPIPVLVSMPTPLFMLASAAPALMLASAPTPVSVDALALVLASTPVPVAVPHLRLTDDPISRKMRLVWHKIAPSRRLDGSRNINAKSRNRWNWEIILCRALDEAALGRKSSIRCIFCAKQSGKKQK